MDNLRFASIAKKYSTGIFFTVRSKIAYRRSPRARTPAAYFKARSRPFGNPFFLVIRVTVSRRQGENVRAPHVGCVLSGAPGCAGTTADRVRKYELRTADACRPVLLFVLALRCGSILYGTTAVQYRLSAVWALRAAVWPAFSVQVYAPWLSYCSIIQNSLIK